MVSPETPTVAAAGNEPITLAPFRHLYDVLTNPAISSLRVPILLVCNKADLGVKAHSVDFIRKRIERELDQVGVGVGAGLCQPCRGRCGSVSVLVCDFGLVGPAALPSGGSACGRCVSGSWI